MQVVYRDLKPENILIDCTGHVKLCDLGFAVRSGGSKDKDQASFLTDHCGTAMYVAPEIVGANTGHGFPVDWWSYGCVVYEMVTGKPPFGDSADMSKFEIFTNISSGKVSYPLAMGSSVSSFLKSLLEPDPNKRSSWRNVRNSQWFDEVDWTAVEKRQVVPPWVPPVEEHRMTSNFVDWRGMMLPALTSSDATRYCHGMKMPLPGRHCVELSTNKGVGGSALPSTPMGTPMVPRKSTVKNRRDSKTGGAKRR